MTQVSYCTRERVQQALGQADSVRNNRRIDDVIRAASRNIEGWTHHRFYPTTRTIYPYAGLVQGGILWLDSIDLEMVSISSLTTSGTALVLNTDYFYPDAQDGVPYTAIRLLDSSSASWPTDDRGIVIVGEQGASADTVAAGVLAADISSAGAGVMQISDAGLIGVGDLVTVDSERVIVTEKTLITTTATVSSTLAASNGARTLAVSDGTLLKVGELIAIGAERMFIESIAGNNVTVTRAENGSILAEHLSTAAIFAPRSCTISRGQTGTTAATHTAGATLLRNDPPALVQESCLALAEVALEQGKAGYGRTTGSSDAEREFSGRGVRQIMEDLQAAYGRVRIGAA